MSGFNDADSVAEAIRPALDKFAVQAEPFCKKAADDIYERLLDTVQDYLRENAEWNIGQDIERCRKIEVESLKLREVNRDLLEALETCLEALDQSRSDNPEWPDFKAWEAKARAAIAKAKGEAA